MVNICSLLFLYKAVMPVYTARGSWETKLSSAPWKSEEFLALDPRDEFSVMTLDQMLNPFAELHTWKSYQDYKMNIRVGWEDVFQVIV